MLPPDWLYLHMLSKNTLSLCLPPSLVRSDLHGIWWIPLLLSHVCWPGGAAASSSAVWLRSCCCQASVHVSIYSLRMWMWSELLLGWAEYKPVMAPWWQQSLFLCLNSTKTKILILACFFFLALWIEKENVWKCAWCSRSQQKPDINNSVQ